MKNKEFIEDAKAVGLAVAGAVGHRLLTKVVDKAVMKASPALSAKPLYRYGKEVAFIALSLVAPSFLKGKDKDLAQKVGLGLAVDSAVSLVSTLSGGRLAGSDDEDFESFQSVNYSPSVSAYLPPVTPVDFTPSEQSSVNHYEQTVEDATFYDI